MSSILAAGATGGIGDLLSNPAISTPAGFALAVMFYLGKLYLESRKEGRADQGERRTNDSHIVEETKDILLTRKEEARSLREQAYLDRQYMRELEDENRRLRRKVNEVDELYEENDELRAILADRLGHPNGGRQRETTGRVAEPRRRGGAAADLPQTASGDLGDRGARRRHRADDGV